MNTKNNSNPQGSTTKKEYHENGSIKQETKYNQAGQIHAKTEPALIVYFSGHEGQPSRIKIKAWYKKWSQGYRKTLQLLWTFREND